MHTYSDVGNVFEVRIHKTVATVTKPVSLRYNFTERSRNLKCLPKFAARQQILSPSLTLRLTMTDLKH